MSARDERDKRHITRTHT